MEQTMAAPSTIDELQELLAEQLYITDRGLAISIFLALKLGRPLFLEGEAGVGKTEVAKVLASGLGRDLIRLQCYEGPGRQQRRVRVELRTPAARDPRAGGRRPGGPGHHV